MRRDVVITGMGVAAPTGVGAKEYWAATLSGISAIRPISRFPAGEHGYPVRLAGEIAEFADEQAFTKKLMPQTDRLTRLSLFAAQFALDDADVDPDTVPGFDMGVSVASATGGLEFGQRELQQLWGKGWETVSAYMSFAWYYAVNTGQISIRHGMRGPGGVVISEQAGGLDSLAFARRQVRKGTAVMTAGGFDGMLCPYGVAIQSMAAGCSTATEPREGYLPFAHDSSGWLPGEGGAVLILESAGDAAARGAPQVYGVVAGHGAAFDPAPADSGGDGLHRAACAALADAGVSAADIDVVFADAAGVPALDRAEAAVLSRLFGERSIPVSAPKSSTGRLLSGAGPLDVATALLSMRDGLVPMAPNVSPASVDPRVDLVLGNPRRHHVDAALVLARGHGGFASAVVLTRP
jgi:minimal PKS chain-length factor (CLF/KS beta)